jgi:hypothetical protein
MRTTSAPCPDCPHRRPRRPRDSPPLYPPFQCTVIAATALGAQVRVVFRSAGISLLFQATRFGFRDVRVLQHPQARFSPHLQRALLDAVKDAAREGMQAAHVERLVEQRAARQASWRKRPRRPRPKPSALTPVGPATWA